MRDFDFGKIGLTFRREGWDANYPFEPITGVVVNGEMHVSLIANTGVDPTTDTTQTTWLKVTERGESLYQMMVRTGKFTGTEEEFLEEYHAALQAAVSAASNANAAAESAATTEHSLEVAEVLRSQAESQRVLAENQRNAAEGARVNAEASRATAEASRNSAETARQAGHEQAMEETEVAMQQAGSDHTQAVSDHSTAQSDHTQAGSDHTQAVSDHSTAQSDHTQAGSDHTQAVSDHSTAQSDHTQAGSDHTQAASDHSTAQSDHTQAGSDHTQAASDHSTAQSDHTQAGSDHARAENDHTASAAATAAATEAAAEADSAREAIQDDLSAKANKDGYYATLSAGYADKAGNLDSWASRDESPVENESRERVRTTGGNESIDGKAGATLLSFICRGVDYIPSRIISSGVNLLRLQSNNGLAVAVGAGWYFPVPKLTATNDSIGTANENNGVLFVDSEGNNLTPTVRFKALADGVPTSVNDGVVATYLDKNGRRHYTTSGDGYLVVSGITHATTCARIAWSTDYDKFVSPTSELDAGTIKSLTGIGTLRSVGLGGILVSDKAERISDTQMRKTVNVGTSTNLAWTNIQEVDSEGEPTGNYTHTATIAGMLIGGVADIKLSDASEFFALAVEGNAVSFVDTNETVASGYTVKYQLEAPTTSNVNVGSAFANISDWGIEYLEASGEGAILWRYAQGVPDAIYGLLAKRKMESRVIAEAFVNLNERLKAIETMIDRGFPSLKVDDLTIARALFTRIALGDAFVAKTGAPTGIPAGALQFHRNTTDGSIYLSVGSESTSDWIKIK